MEQDQPPATTENFSGSSFPENNPDPVFPTLFESFRHKKLFDVASICGRCSRNLLYEEFMPLIYLDWSNTDVDFDWDQDVLVLPLRLCDKYVTVNVDSKDSRVIGEWTNLCGTTQYKRSALSPYLGGNTSRKSQG